MAQGNWQTDQPTNLNYLTPVNFDLLIQKLPKTRYFCTGVNIPSINFSEALMDKKLAIKSALPGDKITFDPLTVKFVVDEDMKNYQEIFNWIVNIGAPSDHSQFNQRERADGLDMKGDRNLYSEIQISILSNKNNPVVRTTLHDAFPLSLSGLTYTTQETDAVYLTADVSFAYSYYEFLAL